MTLIEFVFVPFPERELSVALLRVRGGGEEGGGAGQRVVRGQRARVQVQRRRDRLDPLGAAPRRVRARLLRVRRPGVRGAGRRRDRGGPRGRGRGHGGGLLDGEVLGLVLHGGGAAAAPVLLHVGLLADLDLLVAVSLPGLPLDGGRGDGGPQARDRGGRDWEPRVGEGCAQHLEAVISATLSRG